MPRVVVLVGMMGSGKTSVGKIVAARLGVRFVDTDDLVAAAAGQTVRAIFAEQGEPAFRLLEAHALAEALSARDDVVVAAAGGTVLSDTNRQAIHQHADVVVWLDADVPTLAERASRDAHRPLIDGDTTSRITTLNDERRSLYASVADMRIDTIGKSIEDVVQSVVAVAAPEHAS